MSKWIPVSKELPPTREVYEGSPLTSGLVLVFNGHYVSVGEYEQTYTQRKFRWLGKNGSGVTHWMPLPEPPDSPVYNPDIHHPSPVPEVSE